MAFLHQVWSELLQSSALELTAVVLAIAYLLLAMKESLWCWYCAFISSAIYTVLFWDVSLLMDSALNVFYVIMAVYGWWQWKYGGKEHHGVAIHRWSGQTHLLAFAAIAVVTLISGWLLRDNSREAWPFVDSFTTWASVLTTWMVARKIIENWLYWVVIDAVSAYLYVDRGLYLTALLFVAYVVIVIFGYFNWRKLEQQHRESTEHSAAT